MANDELAPRNSEWVPGTLDKTRKNIGNISEQEAAKMAQVLGGQVMREGIEHPSSEPITRHAHSRPITRERPSQSDNSSSSAPEKEVTHESTHREKLPIITNSVNAQIDKLMMSDAFRIKQNYGLFNFIRRFQKNGAEKVAPNFIEHSLPNHIKNLERFITVMKQLIQIAPNTYKAQILNGDHAKFKLLRMVANWTMESIRITYSNITASTEPIIVADLIPFIRAIYRPVITIYYYGETNVANLLKEIFEDLSVYPEVPKDKLNELSKTSITQWVYINSEIIFKLYPLLMRMSSKVFETFEVFFQTHRGDILKFLDMHKFDLLLQLAPVAEEPKPEAPKVPEETTGVRDSTVEAGLAILNQLFPDAGFDQLDTHPDMFPYFQPMYSFAEGFNMLSPKNPLQITVVLLRIIEDFFRGLRNVTLKTLSEENESDSIAKVLEDWVAYREEVFQKIYCSQLIPLVNETYSKNDFVESQIGKRYITNILWQTRNYYLPYFNYTPPTLEKVSNDSKYPPLYIRTTFARDYLTEVVKQCDKASKTHDTVVAVKNPWDHYKFDLPNEVSKRLDVLLGAANTSPTTNANNANLLKYTLCVLSVLDWWLNNPRSNAYDTDPNNIYRVSELDGKPAFSTEIRKDQNRLFAESVKASYAQGAKVQK